MGDFLKGMMSARPMRDPDLEFMRKAAAQDYSAELRQRRAGKSLPGFLQGDPGAEMDLAAIGIGRGPESAREKERYAEAKRQQEVAKQAQRAKFEWEQDFAVEGRGIAQTRAEKAEADRTSRFDTEMDFRKEQVKRADLRNKANAEQAAFEKLETEKRYKEDKAYRKQRDAARDTQSAQSAARASESHKITMKRAAREETRMLDNEAIKSKQGNAVKQRIFDYTARQFGDLPPADTPEGVLATEQFVQLQSKVFQDFMAFGGDSEKIADRMNAYERALDENFKDQRMQEAVIEAMERQEMMAIEEASMKERVEKELERRQKEAAKPKTKASTKSKSSSKKKAAGLPWVDAAKIRSGQGESASDFLGDRVKSVGAFGQDVGSLLDALGEAGARNRPFGL